MKKLTTEDYPFWQAITEAGQDNKCTVQVFKQFAHWVAMQVLAMRIPVEMGGQVIDGEGIHPFLHTGQMVAGGSMCIR